MNSIDEPEYPGVYSGAHIMKNDDVLVAEIGGGDRWEQANFPLDIFRDYFELEPGVRRFVTLTPFSPAGVVGNVERRPSVSVDSQNYRIELGGATGPYPAVEDGRPIAVFVRTAEREFQYVLLRPSDQAYSAVRAWLSTNNRRPARELRRAETTVAVLRQFWPGSPIP